MTEIISKAEINELLDIVDSINIESTKHNADNMLDSNIDFTSLKAEAEAILKQRGQQYCSFKEHVETYSKIIRKVRNDLSDILYAHNVRSELQFNIADHVAHNVALKLARIIANPSYKDSYVDTIGYLLLFLQNTDATHIHLSNLDFIESNHKANKLIDSINKYYKSHKKGK